MLIHGQIVRVLVDAMCTKSGMTERLATCLNIPVMGTNKHMAFDFVAQARAVRERKRYATMEITLRERAGGPEVNFKVVALVWYHVDAFDLILGLEVHTYLSRVHDLTTNDAKRILILHNVCSQKDQTLRMHVAEGVDEVGDASFTVNMNHAPSELEIEPRSLDTPHQSPESCNNWRLSFGGSTQNPSSPGP